MRHVRILGVWLAAVFAISAVAATSASAEIEKQPMWEIFKHCPVNSNEKVGAYGVNLCFVAMSNGVSKAKGGQFSVGGIVVPLNQVLVVQGGEILNEETGAETIVEPMDGTPAFHSPPLKVPGGLGRVKIKSSWPPALKAQWKTAKAKGNIEKLTAYETPELVGLPGISRTNLLFQEGTALSVPLKIHMTNPLGNLVGEHCVIGGPTEPITQNLTSGSTEYEKPASPPEGWEPITGKVGELAFFEEFQVVRIANNEVVDNTYAVPAAHGCATDNNPEWEGLIDEAIDQAFGVPAVAGASVTQVKGTLWNATAEAVKAHIGT